jgi:hypothetical protein
MDYTGNLSEKLFSRMVRAFGVAMEGDELHFHEMRKSSDQLRIVLLRSVKHIRFCWDCPHGW